MGNYIDLQKSDSVYAGKRVLTIGANPNVLKKLNTALNEHGFQSTSSLDYTDINLIFNNFSGNDYDVVCVGRGVSPKDKQSIQEKFTSQNPDISFVEGLAPITSLLVDQVKLSCLPANNPILVIGKFTKDGQLTLNCIACAHVVVRRYRLNWLYMGSQVNLMDQYLETRTYSINLKRKRGLNFLVLIVNGLVTQIIQISGNQR